VLVLFVSRTSLGEQEIAEAPTQMRVQDIASSIANTCGERSLTLAL
jgi:hypothetical protein